MLLKLEKHPVELLFRLTLDFCTLRRNIIAFSVVHHVSPLFFCGLTREHELLFSGGRLASAQAGVQTDQTGSIDDRDVGAKIVDTIGTACDVASSQRQRSAC